MYIYGKKCIYDRSECTWTEIRLDCGTYKTERKSRAKQNIIFIAVVSVNNVRFAAPFSPFYVR